MAAPQSVINSPESSAMTLDQWKPLKETFDYRGFLQAYIGLRRISKSQLSLAAGFNRGFVADIISRRRRLKSDTVYALEKTLRVPSIGKKYFRLLVAQDEPELFPEYETEKIAPLLSEMRKRAWNKSYRQVNGSDYSALRKMFNSNDLVSIFAASGLPGVGALLEEIQSRTQFSSQRVRSSLEELMRLGIFKKQGDRYESQDLHVFLQTENVDALLSDSFQRAARQASNRVSQKHSNTDELFFSSTFCVDKKMLPDLKKALRETALKFIDDHIQADANQVVHLLTALHY